MTTDFKIEGLEEVIAQLSQLGGKLRKKLQRGALRKALAPVMADAERRAPVDTSGGSFSTDKPLADRFKIRTRARGLRIIAELVNDSPHAHFVEMGWNYTLHNGTFKYKKLGAPFLRPATDENSDLAISIFIKETERALVSLEVKR